MLLSDYLDGLETKKAVKSATSFFDLPWRQGSGIVFLKLVPKSIQGVPAELHENCIVSKDALHVLNIYKTFKEPATVKELLSVLDGMGGKWATDDYVAFHLRMYATSFAHMKLMDSKKPDPEVQSAKNSQVVFVPVFSVDDAEEKFSVVPGNLKFYEVLEVNVKAPPRTQAYVGMSIYEGFQASRGEQQGVEDMVGFSW